MATKRLYDGQEYFLLRIGAVETLIQEPLHWDAILMNGLRDKEYHAFNADFVDGDTQLIFAWGDGGGDILAALYETQAGDGMAQLEFGTIQNNVRDMQYLGNVNLNDRKETTDGFEATVEKISFENLFRTRFDTKVTLGNAVNFDGEQMPGIANLDLSLHSKTIKKTSVAKNTAPKTFFRDVNASAPVSALFRSKVHYIQFDTQDADPDELNYEDTYGLQSMPFGITKEDPVTQDRFTFKAFEAGDMLVKAIWTYDPFPFPSIFNTVDDVYTLFVKIVRGGVVVREEKYSGAEAIYFFTTDGVMCRLEKDDKVFVGIEVVHKNDVQGAYVDSWFNTVTLIQQTTAPRSVCVAYKIFDFLNYLVGAATGKYNRVISSLYGPGGERERLAVTSGYALRDFDVSDDKPVQAALNNTFSSLQALDNIGIGFKQIYDPIGDTYDDYVVVEREDYFHRGGIIDILRDTYEIVEGHDATRTYNEAQIGYAKYSKEELNSLDEYNTEQSWLLPVKTYKNKLSRKCDFIASGNLIEVQRREQYKVNPSNSLDNDDEIFIISYVDQTVFENMPYDLDSYNGRVKFGKPVGLVVGDVVTVVGNPYPMLVTAVDFSTTNSYYVDDLTLSGAYNDTVSVQLPDGANAAAERNENFQFVNNVIDAGTVYNLRLSPHRLFYNFASTLWTSLDKKDRSLYIRNTFTKSNGSVVSQFFPGAPGVGIVGARQIAEDADILLSDFAPEMQLMTAATIECKAILDYDTVRRIKQALRDEHEDETINCGSVVLPDLKNTLWECRVSALTYNYKTGEATISGNKVRLYQ